MTLNKLFVLAALFVVLVIAGTQTVFAKGKGRSPSKANSGYKVVVVKVKSNAFYMFTLSNKKILGAKLFKSKKALSKVLAALPDETEVLEAPPDNGSLGSGLVCFFCSCIKYISHTTIWPLIRGCASTPGTQDCTYNHIMVWCTNYS